MATLPSIHLNGTSVARLCEENAEAHVKLGAAIEALCAAGPNARDYYPQGPGAFEAAVREHESRLARLRSVLEELNEVAEHLYAERYRRNA